MTTFRILDRDVGPGAPCLIIAEVAQAHDGSLGMAHAFIDASADAGADAVKFQTHIAAAESTPSEPWRVKFSRQDETRFDYWRRMEFSLEQWLGLREHADERGVLFLSSPFSSEAVELLMQVGVPAWKVASGEVANESLLADMMATDLPFLISSGMSSYAELDRAVTRVRSAGNRLAVLQCTTAYPCPPERVGLNVIEELRRRYDCPVGLSDHSGTVFPSLAAVTLGANVLEVHVTMSREMFGPDVSASVTTAELRELTTGVRFIERMLASPVEKDAAAADAAPLRAIFTRSVVTRTDLGAGTVLGPEHLALRKPGSGIPASRLAELTGRRLRRDVAENTLLSEDDLEPDQA
ncbi:MAG TPA: N-acetylneuraminate synthase family protein [Longimicrobiales bacterium]|nr:N-acetylneuraminate synthase family protein [Longimicrobiales bacterium]